MNKIKKVDSKNEMYTNSGKLKRDIGSSILERKDVKDMLYRIENNNLDYTVILKVKDQVSADINQIVMDEIISSLMRNTVCQAAYIQNLGNAIQGK